MDSLKVNKRFITIYHKFKTVEKKDSLVEFTVKTRQRDWR